MQLLAILMARLSEMIRAFRAPVTDTAYRSDHTSRFKDVSHLLDDELIPFIRANQSDENMVIPALWRVIDQRRLTALAMDPDLAPYIRIMSLDRLDASGNELRILVARTDHDPGVCVMALKTLHNKRLAKRAADSKHEAVRMHINQEYMN